MVVRVSKPKFNLRDKLSELDKPTGLKGSDLLRSETTQDARDLISAGRRNLFINGSCAVHQRGSSFTSAGYTADHWYMYATGGTTTVETSSPPPGFTHYLQAASATSSCIFSQAIELENEGAAGKFKIGRTLTVSWYAKTTKTGGENMKLNTSFRQSSTSGTNSVSLSGGDINVELKISETWARYSRTFRINDAPHSSNKILVMQIRTPSGALGTVSLTGFQCEFGSEPTEFEHRSYGEELALCQRYFYSIYRRGSSNDGNLSIGGVGSLYTADSIYIDLLFPTEMRASPSLVCPTATDRFQACPTTCITFGNPTMIHYHKNACTLNASMGSANTAGRVGNVFMATAAWSEGEQLAFSAEM